MSLGADVRKRLAELKQAVERVSQAQATEKVATRPDTLGQPDIVTFATHPAYLNRGLFPRQGTVLKVMFPPWPRPSGSQHIDRL